MRIPRWGVCFLGLGCCHFAGCSQTGLLRSNNPSDIKTVASVNGQPVSTVAGEPGTGSSLREDVGGVDPPAPNGSRISGRVFDEAGRAVPNAMVRLGVGGSSGGRVNFARTDRSGAFTLHGLRPGLNYTLIAEYQGDDGMMSGRVQAKAPGSGVRIALGARDPEPEAEPRGARLLPARVRSTLFPEDDADGFPAASRPRAQSASEDQGDREPPAEEATSFSTRATRSSSPKLASAGSSPTTRAGWSTRQASGSAATGRPRAAADAEDKRNGPPTPDDLAGTTDDDGENPLPPARDPRDSTAQRSAGRDPRLFAAAPRQFPDDALPASAGVAPASYSRSGGGPAGDEPDAPPRRTPKVRRGSRTPTSAPSRARDDDGSPGTSEPVGSTEGDSPRPRPARRPTWRELSISPDDVPVDEALRRSSVGEAEDDRDAVVLADGRSRPVAAQAEDAEPNRVVDPPRPRRIRESAGPRAAAARRPPADASRPAEAICRLDPGHRRVVELQLPGLDGAMVSLRDIDADVIVLDFWGSWCTECRKSVEHHRRIQQEFGDKVQVLGIACEKAATFEGRRDAAAAAAKRLGINYPVLVTTMEGACPVQRALQVQFYPTMVVLDREGNILQLEQGATDATLGRLDRVIARAVGSQ